MERIFGNTQGIRGTQLKQLEQLYDQRQPSDRFVTVQFARTLAALSHTIRHPICVYLNRRGQVIRVGIGTPLQTQLAASDLPRQSLDRFSGVRCVSVQSEAPSAANLVAMVRQRLDALITIVPATDTSKETIYLAHIVPDLREPWTVEQVDDLESLEADIVDDWEAEIKRAGLDELPFQTLQTNRDKALLVGVHTDDISDQRFEDGLNELVSLVESAGGEIVGIVQQKRSKPQPQTVVGQGKVEEITLKAYTLGANLIVVDRDISPAQARNLEDQVGMRVVDRTGVILDIFAQRAQSQAGKLQVELAQLEYQLPRLRGRGQELSRLGAGIGTRGPGETKLETERRTIQRKISQLQQEVTQLQSHRSRQRNQRQSRDISIVALVGYTNAGKSTLLNTLTNADVYVANQLFATLDPTTRRLSIADAESRREVLLTDTVGFIHELPPPLIDAFRATLEEVSDADAMIHLVDLSHPAWERHIQSVKDVLDELPGTPDRELLVFNKVDRVDQSTIQTVQQSYPNAVFISATQSIGLDTLQQQLLVLLDSTPTAQSI